MAFAIKKLLTYVLAFAKSTPMKSISEFGIYWRTLLPDQKQRLAKLATTEYNYLSQVANGHRSGGGKLAYKLNRADKNIEVEWFMEDEEPKQATG